MIEVSVAWASTGSTGSPTSYDPAQPWWNMSERVNRFPAILVVLMIATAFGRSAEPPDEPTPRKDKSGKPDERFLKRHEGFVAEAKKGKIDLLLVGDFLTDDWRGNNANKVKDIYDKAFASYKAANFGQGGDHVQHVLWRLQNGELDGIKPKVVMVLIGGTNGSNGDPPEKIAAGVKAMVVTIREKCPDAKVMLLSVPPRGEQPSAIRNRHMSVNPLLAKLDDDGKTVRFVDLAAKYVQQDGTVPRKSVKFSFTPSSGSSAAESLPSGPSGVSSCQRR